jgi:hypothetical protein
MPTISFLEAKERLTKSFSLDSDGNIVKSSYPNAFEFKSSTYTPKTIEEFHALILLKSQAGHCLLKGELQKELNFESRAGSTNSNTSTLWACLDPDRMQGVNCADDLMNMLGLGDVSYIEQLSSSSGFEKGYSAHIFFLFDKEQAPTQLKLWLQHQNLTLFRQELSLTKTNMALRYPLDITTCQNDKLIYIAPPTLVGIPDPAPNRIKLVLKAKGKASLGLKDIPTAETLRTSTDVVINDLRKAAALPERKKFTFKALDSVMYLANPDKATVTGVKTERGFVYLNLNGGDSFAYYHPENNPAFIYNFKGEPTYKTSELIPEYWAETLPSAPQTQSVHPKRQYLAFRDFRSSKYYNGYIEGDVLTLAAAPTKESLKDFLRQYGQPVPDHITDMNIVYDPTDYTIYNPKARTLNLFRPSPYMLIPVSSGSSAQCPQSILRILVSVFGPDPHLITYVNNWIAIVFRLKQHTQSGLIMQGIQGTGKGILINRILKPLLGEQNVVIKRMEELEERWTGHLENCLLCFIDEAQINESARCKTIMANLKNQVTEPTITIRRLYQQAYTVPNHVSWMFASNMSDSVVLDPTDRRFSVGVYQQNKLKITDQDLKQIEKDLAQYAMYLNHLQIDLELARTPYQNVAREDLINASKTSSEVISEAITKGDLETLWSFIPDRVDAFDIGMAIRAQSYKDLLHDLIRTRRNLLTRDELMIIFSFTVGNVPASPTKFTQFLRHQNINIIPHSVNGVSTRSFRVSGGWQQDPQWFLDRLKDINPQALALVPNSKDAA